MKTLSVNPKSYIFILVVLLLAFGIQEISHGAGLNVGEPRTVRLIYFLPNDWSYLSDVVQKLKDEIRTAQNFYAEQMQERGYGRKTFRLETDAKGNPLVHRVNGQYSFSHYDNTLGNAVRDEIEQVFDLDANIYVIVLGTDALRQGNSEGAGGVGHRRNKTGGWVLFPNEFSWQTVAHELGHAFGLPHDFRDDMYIMSYGDVQRRSLSACHAEFLAVHPFFNSQISIEETSPPIIELISPRKYPSDSKSALIRLKLSDLEGLHQIRLNGASKPCRELAGKKDAIVEFNYDGHFWEGGFITLPALVKHHVFASVVDRDGNMSELFFTLTEISPHNIATFERHTDSVNSVAFSPDGETLATGSKDGKVGLWDVPTRTNAAILEEHTDSVNSVAFSPDRETLATGSKDGTIKLWNVARRRSTATLEGHRDWINSVAFSPDGRTLATGSKDGTIKLWDVAKNQNIATLTAYSRGVQSVAFSPDGKTLASSGEWDKSVKLWDISRKENIAILEGHGSSIKSIAFSPDGKTLASGSTDYTIKLWDIPRKENIATLEGHRGWVSSVAFSPDGKTLISASWNFMVRLWDVATGVNIAELPHPGRVFSIALSPDGLTFASGMDNGTVELLDVSEWMHARPQRLVKISGDNQQGALNAALSTPFVVEVKDQYGNPLSGAQVIFRVTTGEGKLSRQFTVENTKTDVNGRVGRILTIGPYPGTNTVEITIPGFDGVIFSAVGVGTPAASITDNDYRKWHVPNGAIERLGKGSLSRSDRAIAFSPDSQQLAVASGIGVWFYDVEMSRELALIPTTDRVTSVVFSPDGKTLASGVENGEIKLWNLVTGKDIMTLTGHPYKVTSVVFSPDGKTLASGDWDERIKLWDLTTGHNIATLTERTGSNRELKAISAAFSPDGKTLASGFQDGTIKLWDVAKQTQDTTLFAHKFRVVSVEFSPDGKLLASGSEDRTLKLWDVAKKQNIATFGHRGKVASVAFSPDSMVLASGVSDGTVSLWDIATKTNIATFKIHAGLVDSVVFSPDGKTIASMSHGKTVKLWDPAMENSITFHGHANVGNSVVFSPDGKTLASGAGVEIKVWDIATKQNSITLEGHADLVDSVVFSPDGKILASGAGLEIKVWDIATKQNLTILKANNGWADSTTFSPDGKTLAWVDSGGIKLWNRATNTYNPTPLAHRFATSVAFSPDGTILASGSHNKTLKLWNASTLAPITTVEGHTYAISSIAFSPDGTILASGSGDRTLKLWDALTLAPIAILEGHTLGISSIAFSPDGKTLASSGGWDKSVKLWDIPRKENIATLEGHRGRVNSVAFSPDGKTLVSGAADGTILLWDISRRVLVAESQRPPMYWLNTANGTLQHLTGAKVESFVMDVQNATSFTLDVAGGKFYWTEKTSDRTGKVRRSNLDGTDAQLVKELTSVPHGIALNAANRKIYLTNAWGKIQRLNFDGSNFQPNLITDLNTPKSLALDVSSGKIYWIEQIGNRTGKVRRSNLDGTDVQLVKELTSVPHGIALDIANRKIYLTNAWGKIQRLNFDGSNFQPNFIIGLESPEGIAVDTVSGKLYWTEKGSISRANLSGENIQTLITGLDAPANIALGIMQTDVAIAAAPTAIRGVPDETDLHANYPNPFNPETWIPYQLAKPADVALRIYATNGVLVRTLTLGHQPAGIYQNRSRAAYWDGRNELGEKVASGIYFYTLSAGDFTATRKMLIMK